MPEQPMTRQRRLSNELALYRYTRALERGDIDTLALILQEASQNADLEAMIYEMHTLYQQETQMDHQAQEQCLSATQEDALPEVSISPEWTLPPARTRPTRWQRTSLRLQALAAVLVVAALISSSVLLFTSRRSGGANPPSTSHVVTAQGMVIALLGDGSIHAYRGVTGQSAWSYPTRPDGSSYSGLVVQNQVVYAALGANIYALHEKNGKLIWQQTLPFQFQAGSADRSQLLVDSGILYASAFNASNLSGVVYALRASDGQLLWHTASDQIPLLTASDGIAYVAITHRTPQQTQTTLKALHGPDGQEIWHSTTMPGEILSATVANKVLYVYAYPGAESGPYDK